MDTAFPNSPSAIAYAVDAAHSSVEFSVKHLGISSVRGGFEDFDGTIELGPALTESKIHGSVAAASVNTNLPQRDEHLRGPEFFDAERHPRIEFQSREIRAVDDHVFTITGELTMRGVTRPIELTADIHGTEVDPSGNERVGLEVTGELNRRDWGMNFNEVLGSGNLVVSDRVRLRLDISAVKQEPSESRLAA